jgi:hypothetical protein
MGKADFDIPPEWDCLFNAMAEYCDEHPDASDDEAFEAVIWHVNTPQKEVRNEHV